MSILVWIIAIFFVLAFWERLLRGVLVALVFGVIGWIFGDEGRMIGGFIGFFIGFFANQESLNEDTQSDKQKIKENLKDYAFNSEEYEKEEKNDFKILRCPNCTKKIKVPMPLLSSRGRCNNCMLEFFIEEDDSGGLRAKKLYKENKDNGFPSIKNCYTILGLSSSATPDEVKAAYRKRISEYHPDKVIKLGDKIQEVAEMETKSIISAYTILKDAGLAS